MKTEKSKKIIAIECRSIEDKTWGVGRSTAKILEEISKNPSLADGFRFVLYFHRKIPDYKFLDSPLFIKKVLCPRLLRFLPFYIYYFILIPISTFIDRARLTYYPYYMLPIIHLGKSIVVLTEDVYSEARNKDLGWHHRLAYFIFCWWASIRATKIMAVSETSRYEVAKLFKIPVERVFANSHGVDIRDNIGDSQARDSNHFITIGQAFPRRHMKEIFDAFDLIADKNNKIHLTAVGADKYRPELLAERAKEINKRHQREVIEYKDYINDTDLVNLFKKSHACLYVSFNEAFGIPPVEALSLGCIPIVADTPVTREIFDDHAFFVNKEHDSENIAEVVQDSINNSKRTSYVLSYQSHITSRYRWSAHAERFMNQVRAIIK